jgi:hypothetical protein
LVKLVSYRFNMVQPPATKYNKLHPVPLSLYGQK